METLKLYEVRIRGNMISNGNLVEAKNPEMAMRHSKGGNNTDCLVIDRNNYTNNGVWWMVPSDNNRKKKPWYVASASRNWFDIIVKTGKEIIHPSNPDPQKRMILAEICEEQFQSIDENPNRGEFDDFNYQLKQYEEECVEYRRKNQEETFESIAQCHKECALAETYSIAGETTKAECAMSFAQIYLKDANRCAQKTYISGQTQDNKIKKTIIKTALQVNKTSDKITTVCQRRKINFNENKWLKFNEFSFEEGI